MDLHVHNHTISSCHCVNKSKFFVSDDGTDYVSQDRTVIRFPPYHVRGCVRVEVLNDCVMEDDEEFNILLDGPNLDRRFIIDPDQAQVRIKDNDGIYIHHIRCSLITVHNMYYTSSMQELG